MSLPLRFAKQVCHVACLATHNVVYGHALFDERCSNTPGVALPCRVNLAAHMKRARRVSRHFMLQAVSCGGCSSPKQRCFIA